MDLRALRYFVEIVRCGGFSRAAQAAHATQPTLSRAVAQLEDELGVALLERQPRGVRVTAAGAIVLRHAQSLLDGRTRLLDELQALRGLRGGELRFGMPALGSPQLFAPRLALFRQRHPEVRIHLLESGSRRLEQALREGEVETAACLLPLADDLDWQPVREEAIVALLPADHPLAATETLPLAALATVPFILFEGSFALNARILAACAQQGFTPQEAARSAHVDFIIALVGAGAGVALLPRLVLGRRELPGVRWRPLQADTLRWQLVLAWRRAAPLSPAAAAWRELLRETPPAQEEPTP